MGPGGGGAPPGLSNHPAVPRSACVFCGNGGSGRPEELDGRLNVEPIAFLGGLRAYVCADTIACLRRRSAAKQLRLFGEAF
jgi:hypothetical protein